MQPVSPYRDLFVNWPESLPRRGIVINELSEATTFKGFMIKENLLLLERQAPDAMGSRFVMLEFHTIAVIKLVDPLKAENFRSAGFEGKFSLA